MEEVAVVKKRGRPSKAASGAAPAAGSPTLPKKRGRPAKMAKGRGRPAKLLAAGSDNDNDHDELGEANGEVQMPPLKLTSGKARGRPRKVAAPQRAENSGNDDDDSSADDKPPPAKQQKSPTSAKRRKLGRPRKHQPSDAEDDDNDDDDDEPRQLGRPPTGAVNLNIVRTGRGPGRPKKNKSAGGMKRSSPAAAAESNGDEAPTVPKKRGRPALSNKAVTHVPSGRPRGRPKANLSPAKAAAVDDEDEDDDDGEETAEPPQNVDSDAEDDSGDTEEQAPKKRGRPPTAGNKNVPSPAAKPRGRPKVHKSPTGMDAADEDSAADLDDELTLNKSRGRPSKTAKSNGGGGGGDDDDDADDVSSVEYNANEDAKTSKIASKLEHNKGNSPGADDDAEADDADADNEHNESVECITD